jgi:hypothetical protein
MMLLIVAVTNDKVWPSTARLRQPGFAIHRQPAVTRTEMESGPPKQLKTLGRTMVTRSAQAWFDSLEAYRDFIAWHRDSINRGADWFDWTDPVDGALKLARIAGGKFDSEEPQGSLQRWVISFSLETWDA